MGRQPQLCATLRPPKHQLSADRTPTMSVVSGRAQYRSVFYETCSCSEQIKVIFVHNSAADAVNFPIVLYCTRQLAGRNHMWLLILTSNRFYPITHSVLLTVLINISSCYPSRLQSGNWDEATRDNWGKVSAAWSVLNAFQAHLIDINSLIGRLYYLRAICYHFCLLFAYHFSSNTNNGNRSNWRFPVFAVADRGRGVPEKAAVQVSNVTQNVWWRSLSGHQEICWGGLQMQTLWVCFYSTWLKYPTHDATLFVITIGTIYWTINDHRIRIFCYVLILNSLPRS